MFRRLYLRPLTAFVLVAIAVGSADRVFATWLFPPYAALLKARLGLDLSSPDLFDLDALPGIWLGLIALALGTLLLVISIASQNMPRLIDIYLGNPLSVSFIWFLIIGAFHSLLIIMFGTVSAVDSLRTFNLHVLLPTGLLLAFPYTYYVLRQSKPDQIIEQISQGIQEAIQEISAVDEARKGAAAGAVEHYQNRMFESLNQLDDILSYINFKGPRAAIISSLGGTLRAYIHAKRNIDPRFFSVTSAASADISFMTISNQFAVVEQTGMLVEQKVMRLLRNAYAQMINSSDYDLASLCAKELDDATAAVLQLTDAPATHPGCGKDELLDFFIVWFNTFVRVAIKDAEKESDVRNLFNLMFYYGHFASNLVRHDRRETVRKVFNYLRIYGEELYNKSRSVRSLEFAVEVIAAEMSKVLKLACTQGWPEPLQLDLLHVLLTVDRQPGLSGGDDDPQSAISLGVRLIQIGLGLFYLERGMSTAVASIIEDLQQDRNALGSERFGKVMEVVFRRLKNTRSGFWEDTDRGNESLYYTPDGGRLEEFKQLLDARQNSAG